MQINKVGFTLIELLVVIAIIAILAAILVPVIVAAHHNSMTVACSSNLKQIGSAISLYTADYSGGYPLDPGLESATDKPFWFQLLLKYASGKKELFWCPAVSKNTHYIAGDLETPYPATYSYNILLTTKPTPQARTATRVAVVDGTTNFSFYLNDRSVGYELSPRHGDGWNVLYVDGHVKLRACGKSPPDASYHWASVPPNR